MTTIAPAPSAPTTPTAPATPSGPKPTAPASRPVLTDSLALLVKLEAQPDFTAVEAMPRGPERKQAAYDALVATAAASQSPVIALAEQLKNEGAIRGYETLVSPNMLVVAPTSNSSATRVTEAFQALEGVREVYRNANGGAVSGIGGFGDDPTAPWGGLDIVGEPTVVTTATPARPYGVDLVGAPDAWNAGANGTGLVYGSIDTGADVEHEAIAAKYRGRNADGTVSHDYNWFDPTGRSAAAKDFDEHGTHTIGTVVGETVGVAPGAKFIASAGLYGKPAGLLKSLQWMLAPTKADGSAPDPTKGADVVGMSWWTGPSDEDLFLESIRNLRAAGIEPIKSAGNNGPGAGTISSPGQFPELLATAAVDKDGNIAKFSSRGPAPYPKGQTTPKPDFAAPGHAVMSTLPGNRYGAMSGTSMAQPHLSAVVLDVLSKYPQLTHDQLVEALKSGATDGGAPGHDPEYGWGTVNIPRTLDAAAKLLGIDAEPVQQTPYAAPADAPSATDDEQPDFAWKPIRDTAAVAH